MNLLDIRAQLEEQLTWRMDEMRFLHNQLAYITDEDDRQRYRKSLVVMLYSHFEGFCYTALSTYAQVVNREGLACGDVTEAIAAASLADAFDDFENPQRKSRLFRRQLPDDARLHRFCRQVDLLSQLTSVWARPVAIPVGKVVDTESNLSPRVLSKVLYRLGFPPDAFATHEGWVSRLLNHRNDVAHGSAVFGFGEAKYSQIRSVAVAVMDELMKLIMHALETGAYKRQLGAA